MLYFYHPYFSTVNSKFLVVLSPSWPIGVYTFHHPSHHALINFSGSRISLWPRRNPYSGPNCLSPLPFIHPSKYPSHLVHVVFHFFLYIISLDDELCCFVVTYTPYAPYFSTFDQTPPTSQLFTPYFLYYFYVIFDILCLVFW
jgi:hypothetical protein